MRILTPRRGLVLGGLAAIVLIALALVTYATTELSRFGRADTTIADGYPSGSTAQPRLINARYWSRHLIFGEEVDLAPGDRFEELTAYVLFHCSEKSPLGDFPDLEKRIRASLTAR